MLSLQTPSSACSWVGQGLECLCASHLEYSCGQWLENSLALLAALKKHMQHLGSRPAGWGGLSLDGPCGEGEVQYHEFLQGQALE